LSLKVICRNCKNEFLTPSLKTKNGVVSFYEYEDIEFLIKYKYEKFGSIVFNELAKASFLPFAKNFELNEKIYAIPVDDDVKKGFSHTAILTKALMPKFTPLYSVLKAKNRVRYAGKSLEFRLSNPRNFEYLGPKNIKAVLVDDVMTTGLTLEEAKSCLQKSGVEVLFCMVLANLKA